MIGGFRMAKEGKFTKKKKEEHIGFFSSDKPLSII